MSYYLKTRFGRRQPDGPFIRIYFIPRHTPHKELIP